MLLSGVCLKHDQCDVHKWKSLNLIMFRFSLVEGPVACPKETGASEPY